MDVGARNRLLECSDCHSLYHQECHTPVVTALEADDVWICQGCKDERKKLEQARSPTPPLVQQEQTLPSTSKPVVTIIGKLPDAGIHRSGSSSSSSSSSNGKSSSTSSSKSTSSKYRILKQTVYNVCFYLQVSCRHRENQQFHRKLILLMWISVFRSWRKRRQNCKKVKERWHTDTKYTYCSPKFSNELPLVHVWRRRGQFTRTTQLMNAIFY